MYWRTDKPEIGKFVLGDYISIVKRCDDDTWVDIAGCLIDRPMAWFEFDCYNQEKELQKQGVCNEVIQELRLNDTPTIRKNLSNFFDVCVSGHDLKNPLARSFVKMQMVYLVNVYMITVNVGLSVLKGD